MQARWLVLGVALVCGTAQAQQPALDGFDGWGGIGWGDKPTGQVKAAWDQEVRQTRYAQSGLHSVQLPTREAVTLGGGAATLTHRTFWLGGLAAVQFSVPAASAQQVVSALTAGAGDSVARSGARLWAGQRTYVEVREGPSGVTITLASREARADCATWVGAACLLPVSPDGVAARAGAADKAKADSLRAAECLRGGAEGYAACMAK